MNGRRPGVRWPGAAEGRTWEDGNRDSRKLIKRKWGALSTATVKKDLEFLRKGRNGNMR